MDNLFNQSRNSSGFFSFGGDAHAPGENTSDLAFESEKHKKKKSDLACEKQCYRVNAIWHCEHHQQANNYRLEIFRMAYEVEQKDKRIEELEKKIQEYEQLSLDEFGQLEFEKDKEENERKNKILFDEIYFDNRKTAENDVANDREKCAYCLQLKPGQSTDNNCRASTEHPIDLPKTPESVLNDENAANDTRCGHGLKRDKSYSAECSVSACAQQPVDTSETLESAPDEENTNEAHPVRPQSEVCLDNILDLNTKDMHYQKMLKGMVKCLLCDDVVNLKEWANEKFSIDRELNAADILSRLDQNETIDTLSELRSFFESIGRTDNVYIIDEFRQGNYTVTGQ